MVSSTLNDQVRALPPNQQKLLLRRLANRNPLGDSSSGPAERESKSTLSEEHKTDKSASSDRRRSAAQEREVRELRVRVEELQTDAEARKREAEEFHQELSKRARTNRDLQKRCKQLSEAHGRQADDLQAKEAVIGNLNTDLAQVRKETVRLNERLMIRDARLREAGPETPAGSGARPEPVPPPTQTPEQNSLPQAPQETVSAPPPTEEETAPPTAPRASEPAPSASCGWDAFRDAYEKSPAKKVEIPACPEGGDRRLGLAAAALVPFQEGIEDLVLAHLEKLRSRFHVELGRDSETLKHFRRNEHTWLWSLTEPEKRRMKPDKHFSGYLQLLAKMNFALLTGYERVLAEQVRDKARDLMHPTSIRNRSGLRHGDQLWKYYENEASSKIPNELHDACQEAAAAMVHEFFAPRGT